MKLRTVSRAPRSAMAGVGGLSTWGGRGVDTALWLEPPPPQKKQKKAQLTAKTDPQAPELTRTKNSAKNEKGFVESAL